MSGGTLDLLWMPPGPVAARFMASSARVQVLNGPVGSGKTTANLMKGVKLGQLQRPSTRDTMVNAHGERVPVRKTRGCVVRDTYRQLWKTTLPSWWKRVPREVGKFVGSENAPASHSVQFMCRDGTVADLQVDFVAIGENAVEDVLRGYEPTWFYLNEMDLLSQDVLAYARTRTGRYPDMAEGGPSWHGVLADCNAPEFGNWLYQDMFTKGPDTLAAMDTALFVQPGGLDPGAENTANLPEGYYENMIAGAPDWLVQRMVHNKSGYSRAGRPCYPEFVDLKHVAPRKLRPVQGRPLIVGLDAGLNPAAVFAQHMPNGQWRVYRELIGEPGTGPKRFGRDLGRALKEHFEGIKTIIGYADPSAAYGADKKDGEQDWIEIVAREAEIRIRAAPTNRLIPRLEAVRLPLTRLIDGEPGFLLDPEHCVVVREGFASGYRFRKMNVQEERYTDEPDKNAYSHPHDALQYALSGGGEDGEIRDRRARNQEMTQMRPSVHNWDPLAHS